ncbi:MAG: queuine tRNA-ribosyltransferase family protein [Actinomycetota bacterium]|nr:queuine tRNA-ribosyltransferase family protein [Actinomycetota bacterium]
MLGHRLLTLHNVHFTIALCRRARAEISAGGFAAWSEAWISRYESA